MRFVCLAFVTLFSAGAQVSGEEKNCMECHPANKFSLSTKTGHASVAGCGTCHTVHSQQPPPKTGDHFLKATPPALCNECHAEVIKKEFVHEPVKMNCVLCHNPHGGLRAESNALCMECHSAVSKSRFNSDAPVALFSGQIIVPPRYFSKLRVLTLRNDLGHPTTIHPVSRAKDQDFPAVTCLACHKPHGADKSVPMLVTETENFEPLCLSCHT